MASSDKDASCANDPDFAVICAFLEKFSEQLQVEYPDFKQLQEWLTNTDEVPNGLRDLHVKLMRKTRRTVHECAWETALSKFCFSYSSQDGWEIERFGYKKSSLKVKLRILRELLESQFDRNNKFRAKLQTMSADSLRSQPIGRDRLGHSYWLTQDLDCNLRIYQEHLDEEIWQVVATNREELVKLISRLKGNEVVLPSEIGVVDEDSSSNSCSAPIVKPPPPEEKDDSQESNQSAENRIPNIKIKLGSRESGIVVNGEPSSSTRDSEEKPKDNGADKEVGKKVKPLVISHSKIALEKPKKRALDSDEKSEPEEVKKHRPTLLDSKREKKPSKYEKAKQEDDEDDENDDDEEDGDEEDDEEGEEEEDDTGDDGEEDEEDDDDDEGGEEEAEGDEEAADDEVEETDEKKDEDVSDAVEDPLVLVKEDGNGEDCESGCYDLFPIGMADTKPEFSEVIEEMTLFIAGEGSGAECLVGNAKTSESEPKATFFFGQPGCLKLSPVKTNQPKADEVENCKTNATETETKVTEPTNGENHSGEPEESSKSAEQEQRKPEQDAKEAKNGNQEESQSRISLMNRKRRLSEEKPEKHSRHTSESETEVNSEILEDQVPDIESPEDIGGKRLKMRSKLMNTEMRKKVEAQRNNATVEETTSSSGEEDRPRKKVFPKKVERELPRMLPLKAKLKQAAAVEVEKSEKEKVEDDGLAEGQDVEEQLPAEESKAEAFEESIDAEKSPVESVGEVPEVKPTSSPPEVCETPTDLTAVSQQETQAPPIEEEKETIEKTEPKDPIADVPAPEESQKPETVVETPSDDHPVVENQRKRRSSEEDAPAKESVPSVEPAPLVKTRTGRRGGPPEPVPELPLPKRTRVKASLPPNHRSEEAEKKAQPDSGVKATAAKSSNRSTQNKPTIKEEDIKKENPKVEQETPAVEVDPLSEKVEPKVEDEAKPAKVSVKTPLPARPRQQAAQKQPASGQRRKNHDDVDAKNIIDIESESTPVRQSRRIAQLKIREEAERRKMEEIALRNMKAELKKKKKAEKADDPTVSEPSEHSSDHADSEIEIKKKAEKKKKCPGKGGWSSGSEEPEEEEEEQYETDPGSPLFKSDHEFSPESELEDESQVVPLKRARTARKEGEEIVTTADADESCQKCGKSDHPEWILLCDKCDKGYHCSCLSPVIFYIPEGDWFCPPCQQVELIAALESHLKQFDDLVQRKKEEEEEKKRLEMQERLEMERAAQLKLEKRTKRKQNRNKKGASASKNRTYRKKQLSDESGEESEENETETDASNSSKSNSSRSGSSRSRSESATDTDDEPIYKLRKRRQINVSYRLNEYDDMIKSALKEEEDEVAGAGNLGRGKDISTIIEADKEEKLRQQQAQVAEENGEPVEEAEKPTNNIPGGEDSGSDFEPLKRKPKSGKHAKKKPRKLTTLDISSEGDNDSDEDFKTSSMDDDEEDEEDEEEEDSQSSDSSLDVYRRRRQGVSGKKKTRRAARRAARERRKDRNFIVDDSDGSEEVDRARSKKKRKKDSDYTESETNDDDDEDELSENIDSDELCDDSTDSEASDGAWRPSKRKKQRSNTIARKSPKLKARAAPKAKKTKRVDDNTRSFKSSISKNRAIRDDSDDDDDDSVDSSRKTRGKRCVYMEDFEDDSSDGGIKPGVKRPDTPPEEREKFIKKQEEIKRMLAEKNAEGAKLAATPRLIPIKSGAQRSPAKLDSLSTVPLSVIRQAKALDIDYLQRKGESISENDLDESEFDDDDLPDDFNPEDMDEEAIARMVEEEDFAQQQLKLPSPAEVLRKKPAKEMEIISKPTPSPFAPQLLQPTSSSSSGLQEPVRKKLPMPTIHPPLLRHGYGGPPQHAMQHHRSSAPPHLPLLQTALSAPLNNQISRNFPPTTQAIPATTPGMGSHPPGGSASVGGDSNKPRGRRKKITPLRDTLQKQQAAAAASAAAAAASKPGAPPGKDESKSPAAPVAPGGASATPGVIKSALSIAQPPQLYKPPPANTQPSVITRMPHLQGRQMMPVPGPPFPEQGSRFYRPPQPQSQHTQQPPSQPQTQPPPNALIPGSRPPQIRHRGPLMPPMTGHHGLRPSYVGGPPPLRPSSGGPPMSVSNDVREQVPPRQSYPGPDPYTGGPPPARHSAPPHLSPYRSQMFGNPGFPQRGPPANSSQPSGIRPTGAPPEYSPAGSYVGAYTYYPPPLSVVSHSAPPPPTASAVPSSVIVSVSSLAGASSAVAAPPAPPPQPAAVGQSRTQASSPSLIEKPCPPTAAPVPTTASSSSVIELSRKKLTTLETFNTCKTATPPPPLTESSESRSPYSSNPPTVGGIDETPEDGSASPPISSQSTSEFSGLVSYFSSQHDDLNT